MPKSSLAQPYSSPSIGKSVPPKLSRQLPISITASLDQPVASRSVRCAAEDGVYTYASAVLNAGLLLLEFKYAIRVEYRLMILRCWKALLLHFHSANHYNCAKEAVRMIATVNALATPLVAAQITWSRVESGVNISQKTITQCGKSLNSLLKVCNSFDDQHDLHQLSHKHSQPSLGKD